MVVSFVIYGQSFFLSLICSSNICVNREKLSQDGKKSCIKTVLRFILFRANRSESISRITLLELLGKLDAAYKKQANAVLYHANNALKTQFGLTLLTVPSESSKSNYYVINNSKSPMLYSALSNITSDRGYKGFVYVILTILFTAPHRQASAQNLLNNIRQIDSRFPASVARKGKSSSSSATFSFPIPELRDTFEGLLGRMKKVLNFVFINAARTKERYVVSLFIKTCWVARPNNSSSLLFINVTYE